MRIIGMLSIGVLFAAGALTAQAPDAGQPVGTMAEVMVSVVYPPANELLLAMHRGATGDKEWAAVQRNAIQLGEAGNLLILRGRTIQGDWAKDARLLVDVGAAAYKAAKAKDAAALRALDGPLNNSCVTCHKSYRPNVHPAGVK